MKSKSTARRAGRLTKSARSHVVEAPRHGAARLRSPARSSTSRRRPVFQRHGAGWPRRRSRPRPLLQDTRYARRGVGSEEMWGGGGGLGMTGWRGRCWGTGRGGVRKKTLRNARHHPHAVATTAVRQGSHAAVASRRRQFPSDMCWCYRRAHTPRPPDGAVNSTTGTAQGGDAAVHRHRVGGWARQWYGSVKATYVAGARLGGKRPEKARSKPYRGGGYRDAGGGGRPTAPPTAKRGPTARNWNCRGSWTRARATPLTRVATT